MSRSDPKVLLVYPPNQLMAVEIPRPDGSLGPLYLAGELRRAGVEVHILDASVGSTADRLRETFFHRVTLPSGLTRIGMTPERLREFLASGAYDIVGIHSNFTPQTRMALEVARLAKEVNPRTLVMAGGVNARALSERFIGSGQVDLICATEGEKFIVEALRAWQKGGTYDDLNTAVSGRQGLPVVKTISPGDIYDNLDDLPLPAWDLLPFAKYDEVNSPHGSITTGKPRRYTSLMTSRGCPFRCSYCHISEEKDPASRTGDIGSLRLKSIDRVMEEVSVLKTLGVTHLYLEDDSLLAKKARTIEIFRRLVGRGFKISNVNGVNLVHFGIPDGAGRLKPDEEYLAAMKDAGFDEIVFPVESACQRVLDKYASGKLNHRKLNVVNLVRTAARLGLTCPINIMIGFPDETEGEMLQSVDLGRRLIDAGAPYVTFFIPIPFPGSQLYHLAIANGHLSADFDPDQMNWKNAIMKNTAVPPERVIELRDWAWAEVNSEQYKRSRLEREIGSRLAL